MQIPCPRGVAPSQQEAQGRGVATAAAALPYLARAFPGEPRIILPQHRGVADWKIPFSDTKLKDKYFLPVWSTLCASISPTLPLQKKKF